LIVQPLLSSNESLLQLAIDELANAIREGRDTEEQLEQLRQIADQMTLVNQNLVLATVKAQALQEEAHERNQRQNEFLAMLAHELRNPMAPISSASQLLEKVGSAHPMLPKIQQVIERQVSHMARLLEDLLDASRISSGKINLKKEIVALGDVIGRAVEVSRPFIDKRRQRLNIEAAPALVFVDGDSMRLSQVFSNLLINASKFTPDEGMITLETRIAGDGVKVSVRDNGKGIDPVLQARVFDLFVQGPPGADRGDGGLGIGLAVAKGITELHGGRISVRSDGLGHGACFEVLIPVAQIGNGARNNHDTPARRENKECRILIIDDNVDFCSTLATILEMEGHQVQIRPDGFTGLSMAKSETFDVIICDIGLPGLNGYDVMAQIRHEMSYPRPFAIAISGYSQPEDRDRAMDAGFDHYMTKPLQSSNLLRLISSRVTL
jgi:two-component system, sensor histidine kinase